MFKSIKILLLIMLLSGCGTWLDPFHKPKKRSGPTTSEQASQRLALYCDLMADPILPHDGDSLYFTGFARTACSKGGMSDYATAPGRFNRWPTSTGFEWDDLGSNDKPRARSENSRDGYLAVMWNAWARRDLATLEAIKRHGERRDWFMGDGRLGGTDTYFTPAYRNTLAEMIYRLGGENDRWERALPAVWGECEDYTCWLTVNHILLRGEVFGEISGNAMAALQYANRYAPTNPLYQWAVDKYLTGDATRALLLLLQAPHPGDRLPTSADFKDPWPLRRGPESVGWLPSEAGHVHSGGDWAWAAWFILRQQSDVPRLTGS